MPNYETKQIG